MVTVNDIRNIARGETEKEVSKQRTLDGWQLFPYVETPDATPMAAATVEIPDAYGGMALIKVVGVQFDGSGALAGYYAVQFMKLGALTLGTPTVIHEETTITGASVALTVDSNENLEVTVTGTTDTIRWVVKSELFTTNATATP